MDILKKMFGLNGAAGGAAAAVEKDAHDNNGKRKVPGFGTEFRKPMWYDEESDDELFDNNKMFGFQVFTNPLEMQKYHERQMQQMLKAFDNFDETKSFFDESLRDEYLKPGFEEIKDFNRKNSSVDVDLDGEIYADQLHTLLQRISPELEKLGGKNRVDDKPKNNFSSNVGKTVAKRKPTDEEKFLDQLHDIKEDEAPIRAFKKPEEGNRQLHARIPYHGGAFEGFVDGPKTHRQSFSYQLIRKPSGSVSEHTVIDADGNTKTIIKSNIDGETKVTTLVNGVDVGEKKAVDGGVRAPELGRNNNWIIDCGRYMYVTKDGYAVPKNLW